MLIRPLCSVLIALLPLSFNAQTFRPAMPAEAVTQQASSLFFTDAPTFTGLQTTGFTVHWATSQPSTAKLHYGASPDLGSVVSLPGESQVFDWPLSGLQPGEQVMVDGFQKLRGNAPVKGVPWTPVKPAAAAAAKPADAKPADAKPADAKQADAKTEALKAKQ